MFAINITSAARGRELGPGSAAARTDGGVGRSRVFRVRFRTNLMFKTKFIRNNNKQQNDYYHYYSCCYCYCFCYQEEKEALMIRIELEL